MIIKTPNAQEAKKVNHIVTAIGEVLASSWFRDTTTVSDDQSTKIMNSNNLFKTELYGGEVIWYVISIKQEEYPVEEMKRTSTVLSRYILIEVNGEVWWNKESIEEDLKETLLQSSFGGSQGKDRVSHRFYQIMALLAHYEDDGVLDDFVQYDDVEDYKKIVFSRCS